MHLISIIIFKISGDSSGNSSGSGSSRSNNGIVAVVEVVEGKIIAIL